MTWYLTALRNYASFGGRAGRIEFWAFTVVNLVFEVTLQMLDDLAPEGPHYLYAIYAALVFVPSLALGVRRLHDTGRSALWLAVALVPVVGVIVLVVLLLSKGDAGHNAYGAAPGRSPVYA
jgi:uncharacterized membrane protein YhaH (DUF805 family)